MIKVLFVCLGNICRSPMAEAIFIDKINKIGIGQSFKVASSGTSGYHSGEDADPRTLETLRAHGLDMKHSASQFTADDFHNYDYIIAMDENNMDDILHLQPENAKAETFLMREFEKNPDKAGVPDPYWSGTDGFNKVFNIIDQSCDGFLQYIQEKHSLETP